MLAHATWRTCTKHGVEKDACDVNLLVWLQVAAGVGFTLFLVGGEDSAFEKFKTWSAEPVDTLATLQAGDEDEDGGKGGAGGKRKAPAAKGGAKKAKAK